MVPNGAEFTELRSRTASDWTTASSDPDWDFEWMTSVPVPRCLVDKLISYSVVLNMKRSSSWSGGGAMGSLHTPTRPLGCCSNLLQASWWITSTTPRYQHLWILTTDLLWIFLHSHLHMTEGGPWASTWWSRCRCLAVDAFLSKTFITPLY